MVSVDGELSKMRVWEAVLTSEKYPCPPAPKRHYETIIYSIPLEKKLSLREIIVHAGISGVLRKISEPQSNEGLQREIVQTLRTLRANRKRKGEERKVLAPPFLSFSHITAMLWIHLWPYPQDQICSWSVARGEPTLMDTKAATFHFFVHLYPWKTCRGNLGKFSKQQFWAFWSSCLKALVRVAPLVVTYSVKPFWNLCTAPVYSFGLVNCPGWFFLL